MPCHKVEVIEYECAKCSHRWINRVNGENGPKPTRCAKCKRWDWELGNLTSDEKWLRRVLVNLGYISKDFLNISPRPTEEELRMIWEPITPIRRHNRNYDPDNSLDKMSNEDYMRIREQLMQHIIDSRLGVGKVSNSSPF
jgi:hypothetical protein